MESHKTQRSDIDMNFFKNLLMSEFERVRKYINQKRECINGGVTSPFRMHMAEAGTDMMEREKAFLLIQKQEKYLRSIERALQRIKEGNYGICSKCGNPIPVDRLMAVPVTTQCIKCKNGKL